MQRRLSELSATVNKIPMRLRRFVRLKLVGASVLLALCTSASATEEDFYFRTATIEEGLHQGSINCFGCSVIVRGDLDGEIVAIGGDITVYGKVHRDMVAVGGSVLVKNGAQAEADVVAIGGRVTREGIVRPTSEKDVSIPWMHLPGQLSVGWRGAVALLGFYIVCVCLPLALLWPKRIRNVAGAARRWLIAGLLGAAAIAALSETLDWVDDHVHSSDAVETIVSVLFLAIFALGIAGISLRIGERFFPNRFFAALAFGCALLTALQLVPYVGFLVMILAACWATGAALSSGMGFREPRSKQTVKSSA